MPNNNRVLINGCNFTAKSSVKNWPNHLPTEWNITNIAQSAPENLWAKVISENINAKN